MGRIFTNIVSKLPSGNTRSSLIKKNILGSFLIKGWSGIIQLILVPLTLKILNNYEYGIWLTISSILIWIDSFDIGLGNGLRNKLAEAMANKRYKHAKSIVSTTFIMLIVIIIPIILLVFALIYYIDWYNLLNVDPNTVNNLKSILMISFFIVGITFVFKFIGSVYLGLQLPAINNLLVVGGQTIALIGITLLSLMKKESTLLDVAIIYTLSPLLVYLIAYPITFSGKYSCLSPSLFYFNKKEIKNLFSLGIKFFLLQMAGLVLFASSNLLISRIFSPAEVIPFQVSYRYFSVVVMIFTIITTPLWTATTDAYARGEIEWIARTVNKMRKMLGLFAAILLIMTLISPFIYQLWLGGKVDIPLKFSFMMAIYTFVIIYSLCYSQIIFGIGRIQLPVIVTILEAIIYIPLAIALSKIWGLNGIIIALILTNMMCAVTNRIQVGKIMAQKATGIWFK